MDLFITLDNFSESEDLECLINVVLERLTYYDTKSLSSIDKSLFKADILDDLINMRMDSYYSDIEIDEVINYTISFIIAKGNQNEVSLTLKEYRVSITTLNRICIIFKFLMEEKSNDSKKNLINSPSKH